MNHRAVFIALFIGFSSCKTQEPEVSTHQMESVSERFDVEVQFASLEDVKRVPLRLNKLRMELKQELSADQNIYLVSIECLPMALDGVVEKLNADAGILAARRH